jgi:UDP-N-acetylglucosamine 2-epimerase (non-hydrolysing)
MQRYGVNVANKKIQFHAPFGFFDFIALERNAFCVLSDSGTVQEECCIFRVANVTIRDVTERPETIECGSNMLSGAEPDMILQCARVVLDQKCNWTVPPEYLMEHVSNTVVKILLGYAHSPHPQAGKQ